MAYKEYPTYNGTTSEENFVESFQGSNLILTTFKALNKCQKRTEKFSSLNKEYSNFTIRTQFLNELNGEEIWESQDQVIMG